MSFMHRETTVHKSANSIVTDDQEKIVNYPTELLIQLTLSGLLLHELQLKAGANVILTRNLNRKKGLLNGT